MARAIVNPRKVRRVNREALTRSKRADRWVPRYRAALKKVLDAHVRRAASEVTRSPGEPDFDMFLARWTVDLINEKKRWIYAMVLDGFEGADAEVASQSKSSDFGLRGKAAPAVGPEDLVRVGQERGSFLLEGRFDDIERWVESTSVGEAKTTAAKMRKSYSDAFKQARIESAAVAADEVGWTTRQIAEHITASMEASGLVANKARAGMIARTGSIWSLNEGAQQRYRAAGITVERWLTTQDDVTCPFCAAMDGKVVRTDEPFWEAGSEMGADVDGTRRGLNLPVEVQHPPLHPNCLIGETPVTSPDKIAGLVAAYSGIVVEITLADSRRLTVTPNHMLVTPRGFVRAASLRNGDDVVDCSVLERVVPRNPKDDRQPSLIKNTVEALAKLPGVSSASVPASAEHLHGDGVFVDGDVDVVSSDGLLRRDDETAATKRARELLLYWTHVRHVSLIETSDLATVLLALSFATNRGVGVRRESLAFVGRKSRHPELIRLASGSYANASLDKTPSDYRPADAGDHRDGEFRFSFDVPTTQVVNVDVRPFSGHVYDLQSVCGLYIANGVLSSNCRCTIVPELTAAEAPAPLKVPKGGAPRKTVTPVQKPKPKPKRKRKKAWEKRPVETKKNQREWVDELLLEEKNAIRRWDIESTSLRMADMTGKGSNRILDLLANMDEAYKLAPRHVGTVHRGLADLPDKVFKRMSTARTIKLKAYASTSESRKIAREFAIGKKNGIVLHIEQKTGMNIQPIVTTIEREVIMKRGDKFNVTKRSMDKRGVLHIFMKQVL